MSLTSIVASYMFRCYMGHREVETKLKKNAYDSRVLVKFVHASIKYTI